MAPKPRPSLWQRIKSVFGARSAFPYEGASESRTRRGWTRSNVGPNSVSAWAPTLRARARDLVRNDAHASKAVRAVVGNVVGTGIEPRFSGPAADAVLREWKAWAKRCDTTGVHGIDSLQMQLASALYVDGEVLLVRRARRGRGNPLRLEILEADMLDESKTEAAPNGGRIVQGVEFSATGEVVAYHLRLTHPGESLPGMIATFETVRIPATDVIHLFLPLRPQQVRGVSFLAPALTAKFDLSDFERFHLMSKKMESLITGWIVPHEQALDDPNRPPEVGVEVDAVDADGNSIERLEPGMLGRLKAGTDIRFSTPTLVQGYAEYKRSLLQTIAAGWGVTYELMTGDLSQVNYSSLRAGLLEFWRFVDQLQWSCMIPMCLTRIEEWFVDSLMLTGVLRNAADVSVEWVPPKRPQVDPSKDLLADYLRMRGGLAPIPSVVQEHGYSLAEVIKENAEALALIDEAKLVLDIDPRKYAWRGAFPSDGAPLPSNLENNEES